MKKSIYIIISILSCLIISICAYLSFDHQEKESNSKINKVCETVTKNTKNSKILFYILKMIFLKNILIN